MVFRSFIYTLSASVCSQLTASFIFLSFYYPFNMSGWMNGDPMESSQDDLKGPDALARLLKSPECPKTPPNKAQFAPYSPYIKESPAEITPGRLTPLQLSPLAHDLSQVKQEGQQSQQEDSPTTSPHNPRKRRSKYEDEDPEEYSKRARKAAREPENRRTRQACDRCRVRIDISNPVPSPLVLHEGYLFMDTDLMIVSQIPLRQQRPGLHPLRH
jgi:hypothetical protein